MGWRGVVAMALALSGLISGVQAQPWQPGAWRTDWWRNGATLDMDFANNRYMVSLTAPVTYTSLTQFISAVSGTFTRAGANETAAGDPFYLSANQSFVSRATSTTQMTATGSPFYADASQAFYSRASAGTYFDSSGVMQTAASNVARADYDPVTHAYNGILIEEARTNLVSSSQDFSTSSWARASILNVSNTGVLSPDGVSYVPKFADSYAFTSAKPYVRQTVDNLAVNATYTVSLFAKAGEYSYLEFQTYNGNNNKYPVFNIANGTLEQANGVGGYNVRTMGNGWYRISYPFTTTSTGTSATIALYSHSNNNNAGYDGTANSGIYLWGVQLEKGPSPTSYIATSGSTVTRAADVYTQQTASYFDSTGTLKFATAGAARGDYHPSTLAYRGILAEPARTNLQYYSNDFSLWPNGSGVSVTQNVTGPDGNVSAWTLTQTDANGTDSRRQFNWGVVSDTSPYVFSIFVKKTASAPSTYPAIQLGAVGYIALSTVQINPYTGAIYKTGSGTAGIIDSGSYWRVWAAITNNNQSTIFAQLYPSWTATWGSARATVMGGSAVFYGAQLEQASVPSSYIPTYSVPASRAADVYTSAYSGTYFDASGTLRNAPANTPRLDYDPSTSEPKGILIEEARTNLLPRSGSIGSSPWVYGGSALVVTTDAATAPDGTSSATLVTGGAGYVLQYPSFVSGTTYTLSFYYKCALASCSNGFNYGFYTSGGNPASGATSTTLVPTSKWQRASVSAANAGTFWQARTFSANTAATGDVYIWGAQLEASAFPTSYIPTSGSTVTRPAENFRISTTTGWYNPAGGTLGVEALSPGLHDAPATYNGVAALNGDGGAGTVNAMHMTFVQNTSASYPAVEVFTDPGGTSLVWQDTTFFNTNSAPYLVLFPPNLLTKWVLAYKNNDSRAAINGTLGPAGTTTQVPVSITMLRIGANRAGPSWNSTYNGVIRRVWYMPTRQPDESLPDYTR